jgi:hypothetical protein
MCVAVERFWSPNYFQHSGDIPPGGDGLFSLEVEIEPTGAKRYASQAPAHDANLTGRHPGQSGLAP